MGPLMTKTIAILRFRVVRSLHAAISPLAIPQLSSPPNKLSHLLDWLRVMQRIECHSLATFFPGAPVMKNLSLRQAHLSFCDFSSGSHQQESLFQSFTTQSGNPLVCRSVSVPAADRQPDPAFPGLGQVGPMLFSKHIVSTRTLFQLTWPWSSSSWPQWERRLPLTVAMRRCWFRIR